MRGRVHAGAWWLWALGLAAAATRTTNPLLLGLVVAVTGYVAVTCRPSAPWARSYGTFLKLAGVVVVMRVAFHALLGGVAGPTVWFTLPEVALPQWAEAVRLGGPVTAEGVLWSFYEGLRLATLLVCVGAANALADPRRLLRSLPAALYEVSVAVVVGLTTAPQLVVSATRIRRARQLRGAPGRGLRHLRSIVAPLLEDAFARSLDLAATMDSRGYGRSASVPAGTRRATGALVLTGLTGVALGVYGLLDPTAPRAIGTPALVGGVALSAGGLVLGGRRVNRTHYRPDRWDARAVGIASAGVLALLGTLAAEQLGAGDLVPRFAPVGVPALPLPAAAGVLAALLPVAVARSPVEPRPPAPVARPVRVLRGHTDPTPSIAVDAPERAAR